MKRGLLTYILLICCLTAAGRTRNADLSKITFGAEGSYHATIYSFKYQYFISPEGFREESLANEFKYITNNEIDLHAGYNFNQYWNLSLYICYTGLSHYHRAIPITLRATRYFKDDPLKDRWFAFIDAGSGICLKKRPQEIICGKIGGGYRMSLSKYTKLDFIMSLRTVYTHPDVVYYDVNLTPEKIFRNYGFASSLSVGIGLTF